MMLQTLWSAGPPTVKDRFYLQAIILLKRSNQLSLPKLHQQVGFTFSLKYTHSLTFTHCLQLDLAEISLITYCMCNSVFFWGFSRSTLTHIKQTSWIWKRCCAVDISHNVGQSHVPSSSKLNSPVGQRLWNYSWHRWGRGSYQSVFQWRGSREILLMAKNNAQRS